MLYTKLFMWQDGYYDTLKERYAALRNSSFSIEHLKSLFTKYFDLYEETGAGKREVEQWNNNPVSLDFSGEKKYIFDWIEQRIAFTDSFFGFSPSGISSVLYDEQRNELKDAYFTIDGRKVTEPPPYLRRCRLHIQDKEVSCPLLLSPIQIIAAAQSEKPCIPHRNRCQCSPQPRLPHRSSAWKAAPSIPGKMHHIPRWSAPR